MPISPTIDRLLVSESFLPQSEVTRPHEVLVMGNELGARLYRPDGGLSDGGRIAQLLANHLGTAVHAYLRLGTGDAHSWRDVRTVRKALRLENLEETMHDVGTVLRSRVRQRNKHAGIAIVGKSGGTLYGPALANGDSLGALAAVHLEPTGIRQFDSRWQAIRAHRAYGRDVERHAEKPPRPAEEKTNAEPASQQRNRRDMFYYSHIAASGLLKAQLAQSRVRTYVELAENGLYSRILHQPTFIKTACHHPQVTATIREGITHAWYNGSAQYAEAVRDGFVALGHWTAERD